MTLLLCKINKNKTSIIFIIYFQWICFKNKGFFSAEKIGQRNNLVLNRPFARIFISILTWLLATFYNGNESKDIK